jgi:hypothetical protein
MRHVVRALGVLGMSCVSACNNSTGGAAGAIAAPSASAVPTGKAALQGTYRWEAIVGYNDKAIANLGGKRVSVLESMRNTADNMTVVTARTAWSFTDTSATVRFEAVYLLKGDGSYSWTNCAANGAVTWKENTLLVPSEIATRGAAGSYGKTTHSSGSCSANMGAGEYRVVKENGETILRGEKDGASFGLVLVPDASELDVKKQAKDLSGNRD